VSTTNIANYVIPDAERVVVEFLRAQSELDAELDGRIYTVMPTAPTFPAVRVTRWGGWAVINNPLWLDECWCQVDTWGGSKAQASWVARLMRQLLAARLVASSAGIVTARRFGMMHDAPDTTYTPAKPHFRFDLSVLLRPPGGGAAAPNPRAPAAPAAPNP
jgi:hypothetical protein